MESAAVGRGHVDPGPELVCRCAGGVVCKCASVPAIAVVYQYAGVQMLPQISL